MKKFLGMYWNKEKEFVIPMSIRVFFILFWVLVFCYFFPIFIGFIALGVMIYTLYLIEINLSRRKYVRSNRSLQRSQRKR